VTCEPEVGLQGNAVRSRSNFRRDIQGLRAVAVVAVILYHARDILPGGFVGVDVFFVISGYVITNSLSAEFNRNGRISLASFYRRRIRRLTPALALTVAVVVPMSMWFGPIGSLDATTRTGLAATLLGANLFLAEATGYFAESAQLNPLLHTWSLSLEEQFYLVFPATVTALYALRRRVDRNSTLLFGIVILSGLSLALMLWLDAGASGLIGTTRARRFAFMMMPARAWQFGVGAALALWRIRERRPRNLTATLGLVVVVAAFVLLDDTLSYPGLYALAPTLGAALLIDSPGTRATRWLEHRWLVRMGDVSYSWYLWHWPAIVFARASGVAQPLLLAGIGLATLPLAMLTYDQVEMRFRSTPEDRKADTTSLRWFRITALSVLIAGAAFAVGHVTATNIRPNIERASDALASGQDHVDRTCVREPVSPGLLGCTFGDGSVHMVLLGDSNAGQITETLVTIAQRHDATLTVITRAACPMIDVQITNFGVPFRTCQRASIEAQEWLGEVQPDLVVFAVASDIHLQTEGWTISSATSTGPAAFLEAMTRFVTAMEAGGTEVVILQPIPKFALQPGLETGARQCSVAALSLEIEACLLSTPRTDAQARRAAGVEIGEAVARQTDATLLDVFDSICPLSTCTERAQSSGVYLYRDARHISVDAALMLVPQFDEVLSGLLP